MISKKIAIFLPSLRGGGAEKNMLKLAQALVHVGLNVDLIVAQAEGEYLSEISPEINLVDLKSSRVILSLFPLIRYFNKYSPSALIGVQNHVNIVALLAKKFSGAKTKIIVTVRNTLSPDEAYKVKFKNRLMLALIHYFYPFADQIVAVSKGVADDLAATAKLPRQNIQVIYNPIVTQKLIEQSSENVEHQWLNDKTNPVILGVGRLTKQKQFSILIRAFNLVLKTYQARLIILGEGEERPQLEALVKQLGLEDQVSLPGFVNNPYSYMSKASLFVLSSAWEGLPTVLIEAIAVGTPVVSTNCPSGPEEVLEQGKYGELVPVGEVEKLAQAMIKTLQNPQSSEVLKCRSREFSMENSVNQYLALLK